MYVCSRSGTQFCNFASFLMSIRASKLRSTILKAAQKGEAEGMIVCSLKDAVISISLMKISKNLLAFVTVSFSKYP